MRAKQTSFFPSLKHSRGEFGGALHGKSHPKSARAIAVKSPMHIVLRSTKAVRNRSFLLHARSLGKDPLRAAKRFGIQIYEAANSGNHIHLLIRLPDRGALAGFLRALAGLLARKVLGAERGKPSSVEKFWDARPFSRIIVAYRDFKAVRSYLAQNKLEAFLGLSREAAKKMVARVEALIRSGRLGPVEGFG